MIQTIFTRWSIAWTITGLIFLASGLTYGQDLIYRFEPGQKFSYEFDIQVTADDATISYDGITNYVVDSANSDQAQLTYRGGLKESKTFNPSSSRMGRGPFGRHRFPVVPDIPSPFSRPTFAGKTQTTNQITVAPGGQILALEGDSQLPYLFGNLSLLPFEKLPDGNQRKWSADNGVTITEKNDSQRGNPFSPFGPLGRFDSEPTTLQAAGERTSYAIESETDDSVVISKTYALTTPKTKGNASFQMTGQGTWTFNRKEHLPHSTDMNFELTVSEGNNTTRIPISFKFTRISAEKIAQREADARQKAEARAAAAAEAKAIAEAPLSAEEKRNVLADLASGDQSQVIASLHQLQRKSPRDTDPEIVAAITPLVDSHDKSTANAADQALLKWSPEYSQKQSLSKDYQGPAPVKSSDRTVESVTPLYVDQIVQAQRKHRGTFWYPAKVKELLSDGTVKLAFLTFGREQDTEIVQRRQIQLAPQQLDQPSKPAAAPTAETETRVWTDTSGRFSVEAQLVSISDGMVRLKRTSDGRSMSIPLAKLCNADQTYVKSVVERENPFVLD